MKNVADFCFWMTGWWSTLLSCVGTGKNKAIRDTELLRVNLNTREWLVPYKLGDGV